MSRDYTIHQGIVELILEEKYRSLFDITAEQLLEDGTFGCVPAYDRFYRNSVRYYGVTSGSFNRKSLKKLGQFYLDNKETFEKKRREISQEDFMYTQMKLMDMCFFTAGLDIGN